MNSPSLDGSKPLQDLETDEALRAILQGTATETGHGFFAALVQNLSKALGTHGAWVTEYFPRRAVFAPSRSGWTASGSKIMKWISPEHPASASSTRPTGAFPRPILEIYPHSDE